MILVTGATGHIGNVLVRKLRERGRRVRALIWRGEDTLPLDGLDVELVEGDLLDINSLHAAMRGVQRVFHLAGLICIMPGMDSLLHRINVDGTRNVLTAAFHAGVERLVYTSSIHAMQYRPSGQVIDESVPFDPQNLPDPYGRSKAQASLVVRKACRHGLNAVIACPTGVMGPFDFRGSEMGSVIMDAALGRVMPFVDGAYDFADVRDVAEGLVLADANGIAGENYILSGARISVRYILETVREVTGRAFTCIRIPLALARAVARVMPYYYRRSGAKPRFTSLSLDVLRSNANISHAKASRDLGYRPRTLYESISDTVAWFLDHRQALSLRGN